jgi:hypothetical protein
MTGSNLAILLTLISGFAAFVFALWYGKRTNNKKSCDFF